MGKREFVSIDGVIEPIKGVVHIQVLRKYNHPYHSPTATAFSTIQILGLQGYPEGSESFRPASDHLPAWTGR